ncbi:hypothetical protein PQX77_005703 [Marasmius sp. AFHP31]|nr:hypothetical protein PQX77_005703 [Marasmius sp. AFHP31]
MDMRDTGRFIDGETFLNGDDETHDEFWRRLVSIKRPEGTRLRALFVKNMSGPTLQMLGAKYNIEPFFFSSSLSWIPTRFQEEVRPGKGDRRLHSIFRDAIEIHGTCADITVILTFLQAVERNLPSNASYASGQTMVEDKEVLDTQRPLYLGSGDGAYLVSDLLAVHLIRDEHSSTVISYHHTDPDTTSAKYLHERIRYAGHSVYWQSIFQKSPDPTFILLLFIWHAMYAWDEALETLYRHIIDLERKVMESSEVYMTRDLHFIRAHHLHYASMLEDMRKSVRFILTTPNPAMDSANITPEKKTFSSKLMEKECNHLLYEIERLERQLHMQDSRLKNVMNLVFSTVNIDDSSRMQQLSEAAVRDSAAMKQIAYMTMVFLPASYTASAFGMNVKEVTDEGHSGVVVYIAVAIPLTIVTIWVIMTFQSKHFFQDRTDTTFWMRLGWPVLLVRSMFGMDERLKRARTRHISILEARRQADLSNPNTQV